MDPYDQYASPYVGLGNDPMNGVDEDGGLFGLSATELKLASMFIFADIGGVIGGQNGGPNEAWKGAILGAAAGSGFGAILSAAGKVGQIVSKATMLSSINGQVLSKSIGSGDPIKKNNLINLLNKGFDNIKTYLQKPYSDGLKEANKMLSKKLNNLNRWNKKDKEDFKSHFGVDDENAKNVIKERVKKEIELINQKLKTRNFNWIWDSDPDHFAKVAPNDKQHNINLGIYYFEAKISGYNSRAGTIVHEFSHFIDVGGAEDFSEIYYGLDGAKRLMQDAPGKVLYHADSFEFYIENINKKP